ncbi:MAG: calcium-binding protein, partial [Verrucomicrobia bacterium]|nr:calcium-binding protein [Verrucomicrobiota bacterium]
MQAKPVEISDFAVGATGDVLDYSDLLRNASLTYNGSNPFASGYLKLTQQGADTLLQFDEDGSTVTTASLQTLAVLKNVQASQLVAANFNPNFPPDGSAASPQSIAGTAGNDSLLGGFGNDSITGLGGDDSIDGQAGSDTIDGGDGSDTLIGNYGDDVLLGGLGNDRLSDDQGSNVLDGGDGVDSLETRSLAGNHSLRGSAGDDTLQATGKTLSLDGGDGNDQLSVSGNLNGSYVSAGVATLLGGAGDDSLTLDTFSRATLDGGTGNDSLYASGSRDVSIAGGAGDDSINVYYSNTSSSYTDGLEAKSEYYVLDGGADNDVLTAHGQSYFWAGQVFITMRGGTGNDSLSLTDNQAGKQAS